MTILDHNSQNSAVAAPTIPDIGCISPGDTAMAACLYIHAGLYVLPVAFGKHPGSILGSGWPERSSRESTTVCGWYAKHPDAGIAIHTGKSGLVAFDLDLDADTLPDELTWLKAGLFQSSRRGIGARGHYVFASDETFCSSDLKLADGTVVGDIRSGNTVIMVEPSPHPLADQGGEYRWRTSDLGQPPPPLPDEARAYLRPLGTRAVSSGWSGSFEAGDDLVSEALADWTADNRPKALGNLTNHIRNASGGTRNATRDDLRIAACESLIGFYPFQVAVDEIRAAMIESYEKRGEPEKFSDFEFGRLVKNGVGYALSRSRNEIADEADRSYGDTFDGFRPTFTPMFRRMFPSAFRPSFSRNF